MTQTTEQRLKRLEFSLDKLCFALQRKGSDQDGNWGWPSFSQELTDIRNELKGVRIDEGY